MWRTSRRWCHRCSGAGTGRSTQHGTGADGRFPAAGRPPRLPATRPPSAGHASTGHDAAWLRPDAATGHASARPPSTRHAPAGPSATGHAPARHASTRYATTRLPARASWSECTGASAQQIRHATIEHRSILGERHGQLRRATCGSVRCRWNHHRAQSGGIPHGCHGEQPRRAGPCDEERTPKPMAFDEPLACR